jgi:hypothetical protein
MKQCYVSPLGKGPLFSALCASRGAHPSERVHTWPGGPPDTAPWVLAYARCAMLNFPRYKSTTRQEIRK